jgi:hypothetical protein
MTFPGATPDVVPDEEGPVEAALVAIYVGGNPVVRSRSTFVVLAAVGQGAPMPKIKAAFCARENSFTPPRSFVAEVGV